MYAKPNYDRGIFRVLPTIIQESLGIDLEEPHKNFVFKQRNIRSRFEESDVVLLVIYDALSIDHLEGKMLEFWRESGGIELSSIVPSLTGPAVLSINTGLPPEFTGFMNTKVFVPEIGNYVNILKGYAQGSKVLLEDAGVRLKALLWEKPVVDFIPDDVIMIDFLPDKIFGSKGLRAFYGYKYFGCRYENEIDALHNIERMLDYVEKKDNKALFTIYFSGIDTIAHDHGVHSDAWREVLDTYYWMSMRLSKIINSKKRKISVFIISDHGLEPIENYVEKTTEQLEGFLNEHNIDLFSKSGRFAMIYADDIDIDAIQEFFDNKVKVVETERVIRDFWPLANKEQFLSRAGKYVVLFEHGADIVAIDIEKALENPLLSDLLRDLRKLRANHGAPTPNELKAFFASFSNK